MYLANIVFYTLETIENLLSYTHKNVENGYAHT